MVRIYATYNSRRLPVSPNNAMVKAMAGRERTSQRLITSGGVYVRTSRVYEYQPGRRELIPGQLHQALLLPAQQ